MSQECGERKHGNNNKKIEKAEKDIDWDEDDIVLYLLLMESKKER